MELYRLALASVPQSGLNAMEVTLSCMPFRESAYVCACVRIPQMNLVVTRANKRPAIRTERNGNDVICMPLKNLPAFACDRIPQTDGIVPTPTGERPPIRTERYGSDATCMPFESLPVFACDRIPKENDSVSTPTGERTPHRD